MGNQLSLFETYNPGDIIEHVNGKTYKVKKVYGGILTAVDIHFVPSDEFHMRNFDGTAIISFKNIKRKV